MDLSHIARFIIFPHCIKHRKCNGYRGGEILWKCTVCTECRTNHPKLCGNSASTEILHHKIRWNFGIFFGVCYIKLSLLISAFGRFVLLWCDHRIIKWTYLEKMQFLKFQGGLFIKQCLQEYVADIHMRQGVFS